MNVDKDGLTTDNIIKDLWDMSEGEPAGDSILIVVENYILWQDKRIAELTTALEIARALAKK